jgi:hypothetical protein
MRHTEKYKLIAPEQFSSRQNKSTITLALNKVLGYDITRQYTCALSMIMCDAKSCYDRVNHALASRALQSKGTPKAPLVCMWTTLQNLESTICTVYGNSETKYGSSYWVLPSPGQAMGDTMEGPQEGIGQGNGAAPTCWAVVSTLVLQVMREQGHTMYFKVLLSDESINYVGYAFVDDADLSRTPNSPNDTFIELGEQTQEMMDEWGGCIYAMGGGIIGAKSYWYMVDFRWKAGEWSYKTKLEAPFHITVRNCDGQWKKLERLQPWEA